MTRRRSLHPTGRATDREVAVVAAVIAAGSEKAAAHRLGLSHSTVKHHLANARSRVGATTTAQLVGILAPRLPEPEGGAQTDKQRLLDQVPVAGSPDLDVNSGSAPVSMGDGRAHPDALRSCDDAHSETPPKPDRALAEQGRHRRHG